MRKAFEILKNAYVCSPYIMNDGTELCSLKIRDKWKIHYFHGDKWNRLVLKGITDDCSENQISCIRDRYGIINLSFLCSDSKKNHNFEMSKLVWFRGRTFNSLRIAGQTRTHAGYINGKEYAVVGNDKISIFGRNFKLKQFCKVCKISYDPLQHNLLFMTIENGSNTSIYMVKENRNKLFVSNVLYNGNDLNELCSFKNEVYFVVKGKIEEITNFNNFEAFPINCRELFEEF